jgi:16S rRNA (guanine1207-N2)-methyltransferase
MAPSRLTLALEAGLFALPDTGKIAVLRPQSGYDLGALPYESTLVVQGFLPDQVGFEAGGWTTSATLEEEAALSLIVLPRSKVFAKGLIAEACARTPDGLILVDGQKTDGVDSLYKEVRKRCEVLGTMTKAHGRLFWFRTTGALADWRIGAPTQNGRGFLTTPGVFSADKVDRGSELLAAALPDKLPNRMADYGAGWGYLASRALERDGIESLDLIEAEDLALGCARLNLTDPRAQFIWSDVRGYRPATPYQGILMNPPFHTGRSGDPGLGQAFIAAAADGLIAQGQLWMVANRHLPYEAILAERFKTVEEIGGDAGFKLLHATRPSRAGR